MAYAPDYDLAVGVSEQMLNRTAAELHKDNPGQFSGKQVQPDITVYWAVVAPPVFDLSTTNPANMALREAAQAELADEPDAQAIISTLDQATTAFSTTSSDVSLRLELPDGIQGETLHVAVTADCTISTNPESGKITLRAERMTASSTGDPFTDEKIKENLLPAMREQINKIFLGVNVPRLSIPGADLSPPVVVVYQNYMVATMFILSAGFGSPSTLINIPTKDEFFALFSSRGLQVAGIVGIGAATGQLPLKGSGKKSKKGFSAQYKYEARFGKPSVEPQRNTLRATIPLGGSASASVSAKIKFLPDIKIGLSYKIYAKPNPGGVFQLAVIGGKLWVRIRSLDPFTILLKPNGNPVEWALSAATSLVVQPIVAALTPLATTAIRNISFQIFDVPEITIFSKEGKKLVCSFVDLRQYDFSSDFCMSGRAEFSLQSDKAEDNAQVFPPEQLAVPESAVPCSISSCLYKAVAVNQKLTGGIYAFGIYKEMGQGMITEYTEASLAAEGTFDFDIVLQGHRLQGKGAFKPRTWYESETEKGSIWGVQFTALGTVSLMYDGTVLFSCVNGVCTFTATVNVGTEITVVAEVKPTSGEGHTPSYVRVYAKALPPNAEVYPTAYAKYDPKKQLPQTLIEDDEAI